MHARNLARHRNRTMGIIVSDIENPFFPTVIRAFEAQAHKHGYDVLVSDTNYRPPLTRRVAERQAGHERSTAEPHLCPLRVQTSILRRDSGVPGPVFRIEPFPL